MKDPKTTPDVHPSLSRDNPLRVAMEKTAGEQAVLMDNETFVRLILKEDAEKGFAMLFKKYYGPLCNHAARFVYSREIAQDIVSEVFFNFWSRKLYETVTTTFRAYLYTAVRNSAYNYLKQEFSEKPGSLSNEDGVEASDPQEILLLNELIYKIGRTIESLPPQCQKVFVLSRFEGRKNREIAVDLDIRLKTVEAHMMKALAILKKTLSEYLK